MRPRVPFTHLALAALCAPLCATAPATDVPPPPATEPDTHREAPDQPPGTPATQQSPPLAPERLTRGQFRSIQVNISRTGNNIVGDAANEPSIAVDPTRPSRMAVGWRQFDTIQSNFRQAGRAFSRDAGHTWFNPGVLTPGTFRSDPVLDSNAAGQFFYNSLLSNFLCDVFISGDEGRTWSSPIAAYGGDKAWMTIDKTTGPGRGHIYAAWSTAAGCCGTRIFTRSTDNGQTWMNPITLPGSPRWGTLAVGPDSELWVGGITGAGFGVVKSLDARNPGGVPTFTGPVTINLGGSPRSGTGPNPGGLLGQLWIAADTSNGPRRGYLYAVCSVDPPTTDPMDVMFSRSTDGGATWSPPVRINTDPPTANAWQWFATMSVAPSGRIDVVWNDTRASQQTNISETYYSYSEDGGLTWSPNTPVSASWNSHVGWPNQNKIGDYYHMVSDRVGANLIYAATFNNEQDVYFLRLGDYDCNGNGVGDAQDIAGGFSRDDNGDGIPDECQCAGDTNGDGVVDQTDLGAVLGSYGLCPGDPGYNLYANVAGPDPCIDQADLGVLLGSWNRTCP